MGQQSGAGRRSQNGLSPALQLTGVDAEEGGVCAFAMCSTLHACMYRISLTMSKATTRSLTT